jgi:hypothetical protein
VKHLLASSPGLLPETEPPEGFFGAIPRELLLKLERLKPEEVELPGFREALLAHPAPLPRQGASLPLFSGTLFLVQASFSSPGGPFALSESDMKVAVEYLTLAAPPISRYVSQYGANVIAVSSRHVQFETMLTEPAYNDQMLSEWVDQIVAENSFSRNSCIVFLNPQGVTNVDADPREGAMGYHSISPTKVPYVFANVTGSGLTVGDASGSFALALSHQVAEMAVDPRADGSNPECCDPCGPNCPPSLKSYFSADGKYMETASDFPPPFAYGFFINAIAKPSGSTFCPAPLQACAYSPP